MPLQGHLQTIRALGGWRELTPNAMQNEPKHRFEWGSASDPRAALGRGNYVTSSLRRLDSLNSKDQACTTLGVRGRWHEHRKTDSKGPVSRAGRTRASSVWQGLPAQAAWAPGSPRPSLPQPLCRQRSRRAPTEPRGPSPVQLGLEGTGAASAVLCTDDKRVGSGSQER